ncbi:hypothetical protein KF282_2480 [Lactococcus lactis subsp. lactis]|uniref:Uncharacterized protein n=1 Tax=Lactococcus lactis subsp. lactis TaxID=1360 RepID=A0A0V8CL45_LACLL|nr:hypothetical protein KF282_2480 [Lactococcus lactis subsp. lactis]
MIIFCQQLMRGFFDIFFTALAFLFAKYLLTAFNKANYGL